MSGGIGPMSNQNVPSPSFGTNPMNPMGSNMIPGPSNMVTSNPSPQVQIVNPNPHPSNTTSQPSQMQHDLTRLKNLIALLRETLRNFFIISGMNLDYNTHIDNFNKNLEQPPKLEKSLEDILALCNQIELCLRTILECAIQLRDSHNYLPFQVSTDFHIDGQQNILSDNVNLKSYGYYLNVIKKQVTYAKSIYEILSESVKQIKQTEPINHSHHISVQQQQQSQMHQPPIPNQLTQMHS